MNSLGMVNEKLIIIIKNNGIAKRLKTVNRTDIKHLQQTARNYIKITEVKIKLINSFAIARTTCCNFCYFYIPVFDDKCRA